MKSKLLFISAVWAGLVGLSGCDKEASRLQSTPQGIFYMPWFGGLFEVLNGKLVEIKRAPTESVDVRSIQFSQIIPDVGLGNFPASITGTLKLDGGYRKLKIDVALGSAGNKSPSAEEQANFIQGLRDQTGLLKSITLTFLDKDGFLASDDKDISTSGSGWTGLTGLNNKATEFEYTSRDVSDANEDKDIYSINVKWSALEPPTAPTPSIAPQIAPSVSPPSAGGDASAPAN
jgi:hypothetical protein